MENNNNIFIYPIDKSVEYTNDREYRQSLRNLFNFNNINNIGGDNDTIDDITRDELNYDEKTMNIWIKWISQETKTCYELQELYKLASATMISLDGEIGLAILFSYDYFKDFHIVLCNYFQNKNIDLDMISSYERLWNRLYNK